MPMLERQEPAQEGVCTEHLMEKLARTVLGMGLPWDPHPSLEGRIGIMAAFAYWALYSQKSTEEWIAWTFADAGWIYAVTKQTGGFGLGWYLVSEGHGPWEVPWLQAARFPAEKQEGGAEQLLGPQALIQCGT